MRGKRAPSLGHQSHVRALKDLVVTVLLTGTPVGKGSCPCGALGLRLHGTCALGLSTHPSARCGLILSSIMILAFRKLVARRFSVKRGHKSENFPLSDCGSGEKKVKEAWVQARVAPGQLRLRRSTSGLSLDPRKARRTRLSARRTTRVLALKRCAIVTHPRYHPQWPVTGYHLTSWGRLMRAMDESCAQCFQESSRIHERGPRELSKTGPKTSRGSHAQSTRNDLNLGPLGG